MLDRLADARVLTTSVLLVEILGIWALLALIPAYIAHSKGLEPLTWFVHALLVSPVIAAILVMRADAAEPEQAIGEPVASDPLDQLRTLAELRDEGVLTPAEFDAKKTDILGRV